jgi:hypothetical protein
VNRLGLGSAGVSSAGLSIEQRKPSGETPALPKPNASHSEQENSARDNISTQLHFPADDSI